MPLLGRTSVKFLTIECPTLSQSLQILRHVSYYSGILPDWCPASKPWPLSESSSLPASLSKMASWIGVLFTGSLTLALSLHQVIQLVVEIQRSSAFHDIVVNLLWASIYLTTLAFHWYTLVSRARLMDLFGDWDLLEREPLIKKQLVFLRSSIDSHRRLHCTAYATMGLVSVLGIGYAVIRHQNLSLFLSHHESVRNLLSVPLIVAIHSVSMFHHCVIVTVCELGPAFAYYHAALAIRALDQHLGSQLKLSLANRRARSAESKIFEDGVTVLEKQLKTAWSLFEHVRRLVERTNRSLGLLLLAAHGFSFVMISILAYSALDNFGKTGWDDTLQDATFILVIVLRLVLCVLAADQLPCACHRLRTNLTRILSEHWLSISETERTLAATFLDRLHDTTLEVAPWHLYAADRSLLLKILSLSTTYIAILLQSKH